MKKSLINYCLLVVCTLSMAPMALGVWMPDFTAPPYQLGETVIGDPASGLWLAGNIASGNNSDVRIAEAPAWGGSGRVLQMVSSATSDGAGSLSVYNTFAGNPIEADIIKARVDVGYTFSSGLGGSSISQVFFSSTQTASPVIIGFKGNQDTGGLFITTNSGDILVLSRSEIKSQSFYSFEIEMNMLTRTMDILVSGVDSSDTAFSRSYEDLAMRSGFTASSIGQIRLHQNSRWVGSYYDHISVVPEPGTVGLFLLGGMMAGVGVIRYMKGKKRG